MANPKRVTTSSQILTGRGCIDILSLDTLSQNSFVDFYDGLYTNGVTSGTHLWRINCPANDYRDTEILSIPFNTGVFCVIAGTGAGASVTER